MVKHKKCCVCSGRNKKRYHKVCDMVELKSYLEVTNGSKYVCNGCRQKCGRLKNERHSSPEVRLL